MLNLAYLFDPRPGPLPPHNIHLYCVLLVVFVASLGASLFLGFFRSASRPVRSILLSEIPLSVLVLCLMLARLQAVPFLSMRALLYGAVFLSTGGWAAYLLNRALREGFLRRQLGLLTFSWGEYQPAPSWFTNVPLVTIHLVGLAILATHFGRSYSWMIGLFVLLLSPQLVCYFWLRGRTVHLEALTPLWLAYFVALIRRSWGILFTQPLPLYDGFSHPDLPSSLLSVEAILLACAAYALLCQAYLLLLKHDRLDRYLLYVGAALLVAVCIWAGAEYFIHRTHGVTANDPYAYTQMAVDIARHGDPVHTFTLFPRISGLGISWWPVVHYGYQVRVPPLRADGGTATDWPPGWPAILALGYLLLGEEGLYVFNPLIALLCLGASVALVSEVLHDRPWGERLLGGAFAAFTLATSYEQVDRVLVPMADPSAQLFTVLALLFVLRAMRVRPRLHAILGGLCFGWAYLIRHTQLTLAVPVVVAVLTLGRRTLSRKQRWEFMGLFGLTSFMVAIPDLLYHQIVFGHFLTPETTELTLFSLTCVPDTMALMWKRCLSGNEFGYLAPLILYGAYRMYVERRGQFLTLLTTVLVVLVVHLPYAALRLRDLLSLFPLVLVWGAYGTVDLWRRALAHRYAGPYWRQAIGVIAMFAVLVLPALRAATILPRPWRSHRASFGYLSAEERQAFDLLAQHTTDGAVVGSSLNGGPIDLYAGREAFRPAFWTEKELDIFFDEMFREGRAVYVLDDGEALRSSLEHARAHRQVVPLLHLSVPLFGDPERISGVLYQIKSASEGSE